MKKTCGVALCTYNGEKYLEEQLDSILNQTCKPDVIVICDDGSTDETKNILERFNRSSPIPVRILLNPTQRGVTKNFEIAVSSLDTDIILLCDQDDIWLPNKVADVHSVFLTSPHTDLIFTNAELIDAMGRDLGASLFGELGFSHAEKQAIERGKGFEVLCRRNVITGATAAFRRSLLSVALPFPDGFLHDEWLGLMASAGGGVAYLPGATIKYRQHGKNLVGVRKLTRLEAVKKLWWSIQKPNSRVFANDRIKYRRDLLDRIEAHPVIPHAVAITCQESLAFAKFRAELPQRLFVRWPAVFWMAVTGRYSRFGFSPKSDIFRDLILR